MARKKFSTLTEPMFYVLMCDAVSRQLLFRQIPGAAVKPDSHRRSSERVKLGPGTLYALLSEFEQEGLIKYVGVDGKRKLYELTPTGEKAYNDELMRLRQCLADAKEAENDE